jgi:hypothetical protein
VTFRPAGRGSTWAFATASSVDDALHLVCRRGREARRARPWRRGEGRRVVSEPPPADCLCEGSAKQGVDVADGLGREAVGSEPCVEVVELYRTELLDGTSADPGPDVRVVNVPAVVGGLRQELGRGVLERAVNHVVEPASRPGLRSSVTYVEGELGADPLRVAAASVNGAADPPTLARKWIGRGLQQDLPRIRSAAPDMARSWCAPRCRHRATVSTPLGRVGAKGVPRSSRGEAPVPKTGA